MFAPVRRMRKPLAGRALTDGLMQGDVRSRGFPPARQPVVGRCRRDRRFALRREAQDGGRRVELSAFVTGRESSCPASVSRLLSIRGDRGDSDRYSPPTESTVERLLSGRAGQPSSWLPRIAAGARSDELECDAVRLETRTGHRESGPGVRISESGA